MGSAAEVGGQTQQQEAAEQGGGARRGPGRVVAVQAPVLICGVAAGLLAAHTGVAAGAGAALVLQAGAAVLAEQLVVVAHVGCGAKGQLTRVKAQSDSLSPKWELLRRDVRAPGGALRPGGCWRLGAHLVWNVPAWTVTTVKETSPVPPFHCSSWLSPLPALALVLFRVAGGLAHLLTLAYASLHQTFSSDSLAAFLSQPTPTNPQLQFASNSLPRQLQLNLS